LEQKWLPEQRRLAAASLTASPTKHSTVFHSTIASADQSLHVSWQSRHCGVEVVFVRLPRQARAKRKKENADLATYSDCATRWDGQVQTGENSLLRPVRLAPQRAHGTLLAQSVPLLSRACLGRLKFPYSFYIEDYCLLAVVCICGRLLEALALALLQQLSPNQLS
jgi:hypothetical protein